MICSLAQTPPNSPPRTRHWHRRSPLLTKSQNDYNDLVDGPTDSDNAAAQQAVSAAAAQLASARSAREKLNDAPSDADRAGAESGVAAAESAVTAAQNGATSADNTVTSAGASLKSAEASYCAKDRRRPRSAAVRRRQSRRRCVR